MRLIKYIYICSVVAVPGCIDPVLPDISQGIPFVPRGFSCVLLPSQAYSPGYVYRVDADGSEWLSEDFAARTKPNRYAAATGEYVADISSGADLTINLLQPIGAVASAGISASSINGSKSTVGFDSASLLLLSDSQAAEILKFATDNLRPVDGSRYFVVRDAIQARGININLSASDESKLGGEASVAKIVSIKPGVTMKREKSLTIKGTYSENLNVCIRPVLLEFITLPVPGSEVPVSAGQTFSWTITDEIATLNETTKIITPN